MSPAPMIPTRILSGAGDLAARPSCAESTDGAKAAATGRAAEDKKSRRLIFGAGLPSDSLLMRIIYFPASLSVSDPGHMGMGTRGVRCTNWLCGEFVIKKGRMCR